MWRTAKIPAWYIRTITLTHGAIDQFYAKLGQGSAVWGQCRPIRQPAPLVGDMERFRH